MCGICGFVDFRKKHKPDILNRMVQALNHRGPDGHGTSVFESIDASIGLGHTRLSIIDLTVGGKQPMQFGSLNIVFNGEVYNYKEIRKELLGLGHIFNTESDTEVVLHAVSEWGQAAVNRFIGMFVYAVYDSSENTLSITRDRPGVKPLYYFFRDGVFLFGSELKSLMAHPAFEKIIDHRSVSNYFRLGYVPAPDSIFQNCHKLEPGHQLVLSLKDRQVDVKQYWSVTDYFRQPKLEIDYSLAQSELKAILYSSCKYRMVADVPVGVFLSGGYDSTAVTALLQTEMTDKLKTFTIGFQEGNNEAPFARKVAAYLGTDHSEYICTAKDAQDIIPTLSYFFDEPFGDSSAIPTSLVSKLARKHLTVALSADGGDEVFCGYKAHFNLFQRNRLLNQVPSFLKPYLQGIAPYVRETGLPLGDVFRHKAASAFESLSRNEVLQAQVLFRNMREMPSSYVRALLNIDDKPYMTPYNSGDIVGFHHFIEQAMSADYLSYLPDDILTKVDRATMMVSLEGREPLLDHRIIEFAARLPVSYKYAGGSNGKKILKDIVHKLVPIELMDRPKSGFSIPIASWLRGELSYLLEEYLNEEAIGESGLFNVEFTLNQIRNFKNGKDGYFLNIWYLLMFQMWYAQWMK